MLRSKKDSMKEIPNEVRHSLEFLDNLLDEFDDGKSTPASTLGRMKHVPADARKSLQILDNILGEFDANDEELRRSESADNIRIPANVSEEVNKSIEVLDQVLDEFQKEGGKPAVRRREKPGVRHEEIRRSLEVLDSVLAEFDDCLESWDNLADQSPALPRQCCEKDFPEKSVKSLSFENQTLDGSTSHDSGVSLQEQVRVTSPPPVPKRSATTKLSDRNSGLFTFPPADSLSSDSALHDNGIGLSDSIINNTSSLGDNDEVFGRADGKSGSCAQCGGQFDDPRAMENKENLDASSSSPFSERRKMFEDRIGESKKSNVSPLLQRSFAGSSFKRRTLDRTKESESEPSSLVSHRPGEGDSGLPSVVPKYSPKATKVIPPRVDGLLSLPASFHHAPNCDCRERIRQLQAKFAETRRLLKANKIRGLDAKPPSFVPPPPSEVAAKNSTRNEVHGSKKLLPNGRSRSSSSLNASSGSLNSENSSSRPLPDSDDSSIPNPTDSSGSKLCDRCSNSEPVPLSETIEDIPKLLPTDALKRPHLGLSYYMEDDLSPGVKDILQTSSDGSQLSKHNRVTSMSTFSLSDSSLGYVSSQSDLEISHSPMKVEKVPVTSIKFSTLPEGMDLHSLPSYYGQGTENGHKSEGQPPLYRDRNFNHTRDPQLRSSSVSPPPEPEKPKKKHFRAFSRKEKKDKKKNDDNISVTSYLSLDDGMILKAIDGDTSYRNAADSGKEEPGVEKKRWSGLRSLLGRR